MDSTHISLEALKNPIAALLLARRSQPEAEKTPEWRSGDLCPACGDAALAFDGMLNLACPGCSFQLVGCFT